MYILQIALNTLGTQIENSGPSDSTRVLFLRPKHFRNHPSRRFRGHQVLRDAEHEQADGVRSVDRCRHPDILLLRPRLGHSGRSWQLQ